MSDFKFYFGLGWEHIMSWDALDHLLFIAALAAIYLLKDWKQVLILVTAFTIGHSLTLALSVMDVFRFPAAWVEFLIPCTIVITAISNLFQKQFTAKSIRINYFLALFFGLEAGQIVVVATLLLVTQALITTFSINRREWVIFLSAAVFSLALQISLTRLPF